MKKSGMTASSANHPAFIFMYNLYSTDLKTILLILTNEDSQT